MGWRSAGKRTSSTGEAKNRSICNLARHKPPAKRSPGRLERQRRPTEMGMWKTGHVLYPGNDWQIEDRQANDRSRAEENAAQRKRREWAAQGRNYQGDYPEQAIVINTTRRWSGNQDGWGGKGKETEHTKYLREQLPDAEEERIEGQQRLKKRKDRSRQRREAEKATDHIENAAEADKRRGSRLKANGEDKKCISRRRLGGELNFDFF